MPAQDTFSCDAEGSAGFVTTLWAKANKLDKTIAEKRNNLFMIFFYLITGSDYEDTKIMLNEFRAKPAFLQASRRM